MCFLRKLETFVIFWGEMQEISALQASIESQIFSKFQSNISFSHPDVSLMTNDLTLIKFQAAINYLLRVSFALTKWGRWPGEQKQNLDLKKKKNK